jgi:hypothetical protein
VHKEFVSEAIAAGLKSGATVMEVAERDLTCVLPLRVAENAAGKLRLIFDGRFVNQFVGQIKFKMESLHKEGRIVFAGCMHGSVIDMSSVFHHVELSEGVYKYFGFSFNGRWYCFRSLPFGLTSSPSDAASSETLEVKRLQSASVR